MAEQSIGSMLPEGEAKILNDRFNELKSTLPEDVQLVIPNAVCYSLKELQGYLGSLKVMFEESGIPEEQRGVAMMLGQYDDSVKKEHLRNKVTVMFIASRVESDDQGKITKIDNCIIKAGEFDPPGEVGDVSYDVGSLDP